MNMHMPQDEEARVELEQLALNAKHAISPANNAAIIGLFQDSLLGAFQLTRPTVSFDMRDAMGLLAFYDDFDARIFRNYIGANTRMTPYDIISNIMPPLSLRMNNKLHDGSKPDEHQPGTVVEIKDGKVLRGQMDSSVFGATSIGLIQSIHTDYGYKRMTKFIDAMQMIITEYMKKTGFSAGVSDLIADNETKEAIIRAINDKKKQAKRLIDMVLTGTFENTTGKSNLEHFEMEVNAILNTAQDEAGKLGRQKLARTNRFVTMVNAGSKGKNLNIAQMISCLGQQNVDGKRIPYGFEHRTLPHYSKFDDAPEARGFVENSFVGGLTPQEMFFHAMGGRVGLIDTAVKTASTGYIQRRLIKSMEDLKTCYDMTVRNSKDKIIQFRYGDDAVDAMKIETQKLPILTMDTDQIYEHYVIVPNEMKRTYKTIFTEEVMEADHSQFHKEIRKDITEILDLRSDILHNVFGDLGLDEDRFTVPVHFNRIINNVRNQMAIDNNSTVDISPMEALTFVRNIYNNKLAKLHYAPPTKLFEIMYFYHLTPKNLLVRHRFNRDAIIYLLEQIVLQYKKSLVHAGEMVGIVAAQSIGEPTTQLSLLRTERVVVVQKHKTTGNVSVIANEIGTFCDGFIEQYPELTFNTGHKDSVETIIEDAEHEYYIPSVSADEKVQWTRISHVSRHIVNGDMVRVKTRSGREVHTTLAHSHLILQNKRVVPIKASNLSIGTQIPICGNLSLYNNANITKHYDIDTTQKTHVMNTTHDAVDMALYLNTRGIHTKLDGNTVHIVSHTTSGVIWDEIVEIEKYTPDQTEYVYDFTVPIHQTFMTAHGVFVHNTLNTFHSAGNSANSNATRGVPRIEEILSLTSNQKSSTTVIFMRPEVQHEQQQAKTIQNLVENTILADIVEKTSIHYDPDPTHTTIAEDKELMDQYREFMELFVGDADTTEQVLSKWIIRIVFNKTEMLERGITMEDVNYALQHAYPDTFSCVYSDYNADKLVMRINLTTLPTQQEKVKKDEQKKMVHYTKLKPIDITDDIYYMKTTQMNILNNVVLKGIKGIKKANLRNIKSKLVEVDGEFKKSNMWVLDTVGTNLLDILAMDDIDTRRTYSNNIIEMNDVLGVEAARQSIYMELNEVMEFGGTYINYHHLGLLVDRMTCNSWLVAISRNGVNNDDVGVISKASFEQTPEMFFNAARYAELDNMRGVSANVMCGQEGYFGTSSFQLVLDMNKVMEQQAVAIRDEIDMNEYLQTDDPTQKCAIQNIRISTVSTKVLKPADIGGAGVGDDDDEYTIDF